jgi:hypothetical protein
MLAHSVLGLTVAETGLATIGEARQDIADYTACRELDPETRDACLEHLDMLEAAILTLNATI